MTAKWSDGVTISGEKPFRKVVATRPIKRGEIILRELPVLTLLNPKQWGVRCNGCFSKPSDTKLLRCSRCRRFWYCTKNCQRKDWKLHKEECTALLNHGDKLTADEESHLADALLVARTFRLKESSPEQFQIIQDLVFHEDCIQQNHKDIAKLFLTMKLLDDSANTAMNTTTRDILEMLARFDSNNFGIVCELLFFLGAGIYPAGAMLNHSCAHNCAINYESQTNQQIIRCIVDVAEGEELCHPYIDFASTSVQRREKLRKTYGFDCKCDRCVDPDGRWAQVDRWLSTDSAEANHIISKTEPLLQQAAMMDDIEVELSLIRQCVDARASILHPRHLSLYLARSQLHTTSMAAGKLEVAMEQCLEIVETMRKCFYRPEHPLMGIMLYTLGSLHHSLNSFDKAIDCYDEALPILESYHGVNHSFTQGCRDYLRQAQQDAKC
jgi:[histone H3]-lysine4/36 N-trimethyltransferase SMYD